MLQSMGSERVGHERATKLNYQRFTAVVAQLVKNLPAMQETLVIELKDISLSPFRIHLICSVVFSASECIS